MVGIYARQSIYKKDSLSIDAQIELCKNAAGAEECTIYQDAGFSGKNTNRPEFKRLMNDVKEGKINRVICYRIDRISRSIADFGKIWEELDKHHVEFTSVTEQFDTSTPIGRAMLYIIMVFAQLERETTAQRVTDNYYKRAKEGAWPGGMPPYGFDRAREPINGKLQTVLVPNDKIQHVLYMFERYATGSTSLGRVADEMKERDKETNAVWSNVRVRRILSNPIYAAADADLYAYYNVMGTRIENDVSDFDGQNSAILLGYRYADSRLRRDITEQRLIISSTKPVVASTLFITVQNQLKRNKQITNTKGSRFSWLSGLIKCAACGYSLRVNCDSKTGRVYYNCTNKYGPKRSCTARHSERPEIVEQYVIDAILERSCYYIAHKEEKISPENTEEVNVLKLQMLEVQKKQKNLVAAIEEGGAAAMRLLASELERLDTEMSALTRQIDMINSKEPKWIPTQIIDLNDAEFETKREISHSCIEYIDVLNDTIKIHWK